MRSRGEAVGSLVVPARRQQATEDPETGGAPGNFMPAIEVERQRLENERQLCEANMRKLDLDLAKLQAEREVSDDAVQADPLARLRLVASMSDELRTALHAILGYAQLFRLRGGLDFTQTEWVNVMLAAGTQLLEKVHCVVGLADIGTDPSEWLIDDEPLPTGQKAGANMDYPHEAYDVAETGEALPQSAVLQVTPALHVLVVDDLAMSREIAATFIKVAGHSVVLVESGAEAVTAAGSADFDVILMDVRMPDMDGMEATRRIRAMAGPRGCVPIVALTAQASTCKVDACRAAGMNGHLAKPFRYDTLNDTILAAAAEGRAKLAAGWPSPDLPAAQASGFLRDVGRNPSQPGDTPARSSASNIVPLPREASNAWIDIVSPWNSSTSAGRSGQPGPAAAYILDTQFKIKLTSIGVSRGRHLVAGSVRTCVPMRSRNVHEFHWLLFTDPAPVKIGAYTASCDLWRWAGSHWQSISVAGALFTPDEMYEQGWRYCGPCVEKTAIVEVD